MDPGALGPRIDEFTSQLAGLGYTRLTVLGYADAARHFAEWLRRSGITLADIDHAVAERFAHHRCRCSGYRRHDRLSAKYVNRVRRFVRFLDARGVVHAAAPKPQTAVNERVAEFQAWLRQHRGISVLTIERHARMIMKLLPALGDDPGAYDAALVRQVILMEARRCSCPYVKTMTTALRGYLRFLAAQGLSRPWLDRAVPTIPQWRLAALPRYLPGSDVERLIAACDLTTEELCRVQLVPDRGRPRHRCCRLRIIRDCT
jgi:site-specific recombinase XerD